MAKLMNLLIVSAAFVMSAVAVNVVTFDKAEAERAVMRRDRGAQVHLDPNGHVEKVNEFINVKAAHGQKEKVLTPENRQFVLMAEGVDTCTGNGHWLEMTDEICRDAADKLLGLTIHHDTAGYFLNNSESDTLPHPQYCFYDGTASTLKFNALESHASSRTGRKVCLRARFINGTENADSAKGTGCNGDSQPILNYDECWRASIVFDGGAPSRILDFQENKTTAKTNRPHGCYRMSADYPAEGGWLGFNPSAPTVAVTQSMPICENIVQDAGKVSTR